MIAVQLVCGSTGLGQHTSAPPSIEWQQSFGGSKDDFLLVLQPTADGGFIVGGETSSGISGNKTTPSLGGWTDYWILRLDSQGNKLWEQTLGGAGDDRLTSVIQTSDGGFILGGMSDSATNSIKTDPGYGRADFWVVRLDAAGNKLWDRCYGGASGDSIYAMRQINDGGFIFGGWSGSTPGGNKSSPLYGDRKSVV